jgi:hypothetical protein
MYALFQLGAGKRRFEIVRNRAFPLYKFIRLIATLLYDYLFGSGDIQVFIQVVT